MTASLSRSLVLRVALAAALAGCNQPMAMPDACATCSGDVGLDANGGGDDAAPPDAGSQTDANADVGPRLLDGGPGVDMRWSQRQACVFGPGARATDTLGDVAGARTAIQHVIVVMQENRSYDHMFAHTAIPGMENVPAGYTNPMSGGGTIAPYHLTTPCVTDIPHQWAEIHAEWHAGAMDGFFNTDGMTAMGYYTDADHPFHTWMLGTFATSDRYFADVLSGTWPNRDYLYAGNSNGVMSTGMLGGPTHTIFDELDSHSITWAEYNGSPTECLQGSLGSAFCLRPGVRPYTELAGVLAVGTALPAVSFVDLEPFDEHPPEDFRVGEAAVRSLMLQIFASPAWAHTAVFFTYDENGGFFDHVPPPPACLATRTQTMFNNLGMRVPVAVVSPYARGAYVSHLTHAHSSILRFIEAVFDIPAMTGRDANADAMLDMFDFSSARFATPPAAASVPAAVAHDPTCPM